MDRPILYLLGSYPRWSETFIRQDLALLIDSGMPIIPVSLFPGDTEPEEGWPEVRCLNPGSPAGEAPKFFRNPGGLIWNSPVVAWLRTKVSLSMHRGEIAALGELVKGMNISHIHAEFADLPGLLAAELADRMGISYSIGVHARDIFVSKYDPGFLFNRASFVTVCNSAAEGELLRRCPAVRGRTRLIYHGLKLEEWPWRPPPAPHSPAKLLFVGRLVRKKGLGDLLKALGILRSEGREVCLSIAGDGPLGDELRGITERIGIQGAVEWCGVVSRCRIGELLRQSDCLVVPSTVSPEGDRDGIPNVVLEGMATGVPVVGTEAGSLPEVLSEKTGWPCPPSSPDMLAEKIAGVLSDPDTARSTCLSARKFIETEFDAERLAEQRMRLFHEHLEF